MVPVLVVFGGFCFRDFTALCGFCPSACGSRGAGPYGSVPGGSGPCGTSPCVASPGAAGLAGSGGSDHSVRDQ